MEYTKPSAIILTKNRNHHWFFIHELSKVLNRPSYPSFLKAPSFIIKLFFGELSSLVLNGLNVSSKKIQNAGFKYSYESVDSALENIYNNQ